MRSSGLVSVGQRVEHSPQWVQSQTPILSEISRSLKAVAKELDVPVIDDDVLLYRQYRTATGGSLLEIPAGKLDVAGEVPEAAAARCRRG